MMVTVVDPRGLRDTVDYAVESADGAIGRVEEIWLGPGDEPEALAVRTKDGARALLLDEDVVAVDREHRWVVVAPHPELLELDAPRLDGSDGGKLAASWATTGAVVRIEPTRSLPDLRLALPRPAIAERPLWQLVAILYASITFVVVGVIALVFFVSWLVGGAPY
jgi:hypothetical protein